MDDLVGTVANDTFNGLFGADTGAGDDTTTVSNGDIIDGGDGDDLLNILVRDDQSEGNILSISNIETVSIRDLDGLAIDAASWDGVETLRFDRSTANSAVDNVQNGVAIALNQISDEVSVIYDTDALDSDEYEQVVSTSGDIAAVLTLTTAGDDVITSIAINVDGDAEIALEVLGTSADGIETITVSGAGDVEITEDTTAFDDLETVDASELEGGLTIDLTLSTEDVTLTGGSGDDAITTSGGDDEIDTGAGDDEITVAATGDVTIDAGAGDDTVTITAGGLDDDDTIDGGSGTNTIVVDADDLDALETAIVDEENVTNFTSLAITGAAAAAVSFDADAAGINAIEIAVDVSQNLTIDSFDGGTLTISVDQDVLIDVTADELVLNLTDNVTSVDEFTATGTTDLVINVDAAVVIDAFFIVDVESLTITGDQDLDLDTLTTAAALETIDTSGMTGTLEIDLDDSEGVEFIVGNLGAGSEITLDTDEAASDILVFGDTLDNDVTIDNFTDGDSIIADLLDLSALGISSIGDLDFAEAAGDTTITSDLFDGSIVLLGVTIAGLNAANFEFA